MARIRVRRPGSRRRANPDAVMSVWDHLGELRSRLIRSLVYVAVAFVVCWAFFDPVLDIISEPWLEATGEERLKVFNPTDPVALKLKVVSYMAIAVAMPFILWELWRFVSPGLTSREKKWVAPFFPLAFVLFCLGIFIGYLTLPRAAEFIVGFAGDEVQVLTGANAFLGFFTFFMLAFGITFQFPIVLFILQAAHVVNWRQLLAGWRYALVIVVVFAAVITPSQDPYSMLLLALPMVLFYFAAIFLGWIVFRDRAGEEALEAPA